MKRLALLGFTACLCSAARAGSTARTSGSLPVPAAAAAKADVALPKIVSALSGVAAPPSAPADPDARQAQEIGSQVRAYRQAHEREIVKELMELLAIPNLASDKPNIRRNAELLMKMLERRGAQGVRLLEVEGASPAVYGEIKTPGATKTLVVYAHYDGQPLGDLSKWATPPFEPVLRDKAHDEGGRIVDLSKLGPTQPLDPQWRVYARSASDDKAPIVGTLAAIDAMRANAIEMSANIKFFFEGEEEAASPNLTRILDANKELLKSDGWLFLDGPTHALGRYQIVYGVRGGHGLNLTFLGARRGLHSGHYGGWAKNPVELKEKFIESLGTAGHVAIEGFYDDVRPISASERAVLARVPDLDLELRQKFGILVLEENVGRREETHLRPALNYRGEQSGTVGVETSVNAIPPEAKLSIDLRIVPDQTPEKVVKLIERHIEKQGFVIVRSDEEAEVLRTQLIEQLRTGPRKNLPPIVKVEPGPGYAGLRLSPEHPFAKAVAQAMESAVGPIVELPSMGGSLPLYPIWKALDQVPVIIVSMVNSDNNQHAPNENLRLKNLWDAIEAYAALIARVGALWK